MVCLALAHFSSALSAHERWECHASADGCRRAAPRIEWRLKYSFRTFSCMSMAPLTDTLACHLIGKECSRMSKIAVIDSKRSCSIIRPHAVEGVTRDDFPLTFPFSCR